MSLLKKVFQKIQRYIQTRRNTLLFYSFYITERKEVMCESIDEFIDITDFDSLVKYAKKNNGTLYHLCNDDCSERFKKGAILSIAVKSGEWVSYGWLATSGNFWIAEIDQVIDLYEADAGILFDFFTREKFRGKSIYPAVIAHLNCLSKKDTNIIYCFDTNIASQNGIIKAGGVYDGLFRYNSENIASYFKSHGFIRLGSKLKLFGLRYADLKCEETKNEKNCFCNDFIEHRRN